MKYLLLLLLLFQINLKGADSQKKLDFLDEHEAKIPKSIKVTYADKEIKVKNTILFTKKTKRFVDMKDLMLKVAVEYDARKVKLKQMRMSGSENDKRHIDDLLFIKYIEDDVTKIDYYLFMGNVKSPKSNILKITYIKGNVNLSSSEIREFLVSIKTMDKDKVKLGSGKSKSLDQNKDQNEKPSKTVTPKNKSEE